MKLQDSIAFFNSNSNNNYLCLGEEVSFTADETVDFEQLQVFIDTNKGKFIYGYISYDAKNSIEKCSSNNPDFLHFPVVNFVVPEYVVKVDDNQNRFYIQGIENKQTNDQIENFLNPIQVNNQTEKKKIPFKSRISKEKYIETINELKSHIQRGDIYEVNFCQEFYAEKPHLNNPIDFYTQLNDVTQTPFSVYLQQAEHIVFCGSPERFIQKKGTKIYSQPIKGTAPRGKSIQEDNVLKNALANNPKEISENVMIVDLVRNDLSKIALKGSVQVEELFGIHTFKTVHQMISTISCEVADVIQFSDVIKATFPMGSMTGAPKLSAMQLIEKYESFRRGLYSGTIGYILPNGDFDFNVVIRTLLYNSKTNYLSASVGGAITINSDPEKEFEECRTKMDRILQNLRN